MLDTARIRAVTLDLDDTLWPIWPTIARAESALCAWLAPAAPATARLLADRAAAHAVRQRVLAAHPQHAHDLNLLRRESIRQALRDAGDDPALAEPAFDVFFAERQRVDLFDDAQPALEHLAARWPVVALSNGNADLHAIGIAHYFHASVSARVFGVAKPDVRIFHAGAQAAGVAAAQVLHVGDDAALDMHGALAAGMQTAWVNRAEQPWAQTDGAGAPHATVSSLAALCQILP